MKTYKLTKEDKDLIKIAEKVIKINLSKMSTVGSALRTKSKKVYSGISMLLEGSEVGSICGETAAISSMLSNKERKIETIVAISLASHRKNPTILPPCGTCRHIINHFGNPYIIINKNKKVKLNELYPLPIR